VQLLDRLAGDLVGWSIGFIAEEDSILHSATPVLSCTHHLLILPLISVADCLSSPTCAFCPPTYLIDSEVDSALKISVLWAKSWGFDQGGVMSSFAQ
jgi:hypothetical protein